VLKRQLSAGETVLPMHGKAKPQDYDIPNGHFFTQTNGRSGSASGFEVTDEAGVPLWSGFKSLGGVDTMICVDACHDVMFSRPRWLATALADRCRRYADI